MDRPVGRPAFQSDAYEGVRSESTPPYSLHSSEWPASGHARYGTHVLLAGGPRTRLLKSVSDLQSLARCGEHLGVLLEAMSA